MSYVVWFGRFDPGLATRVGGKCAVLGELTTAGLPVPPGFAVTTDAYLAACNPLADRLRDVLAGGAGDQGGAAGASAAARALVEAAPIPGPVRDAVASAYAELCDLCSAADLPVAVRSSAVGKDAPDASFAGEHDTYLWVRGTDEVLAAVRRCWASLFTERAVAYRRRISPAVGLPGVDAPAMAVAVQQMVLAEAAGVAFTSTRATATAPRSRSRHPGGWARPWWAAR